MAIKAIREYKECDIYRSPESKEKGPMSVNDYIKKLGCVAPAVPLDQFQFEFERQLQRLAADLRRKASVLVFTSQGKTGTRAKVTLYGLFLTLGLRYGPCVRSCQVLARIS